MTAAVEVIAPVQPLETLASSRSERLAARLLQLGAIAIVVVVSTYHAFELDRFFVPKELVLHLAAVLAALLTLRSAKRIRFAWPDLLVVVFLALSILSAGLAQNQYLAIRGVAITASSIALFWAARALSDAGLQRRLVSGVAFAVVLTAFTSLLQTYGLDIELFSVNRIPGGTLGNRNFVAHVCAFGAPLILLIALRTTRAVNFLVAACGASIVIATLVLTRSRGAWLALGVSLIVFFIAVLATPPVRRMGRTWRRVFVILLFAAIGVGAALVIPNTLRWRSDNPYLETAKKLTNYQRGSGRGRLVQYQHSMKIALYHPLFGVGAGNWAVEYPHYVPPDDPSLNDSDAGTTSNPWPSSDWVAFIVERGFTAAIVLGFAFAGIAFSAIRRCFRATDFYDGIAAVALVSTIAAALVAGAFDAVLLLAVPSYLVWIAIGALWIPYVAEPEAAGSKMRGFVVFIVMSLAAIGIWRSSAQIVAMGTYVSTSDRASLERASAIDPGNYRLHLRLARSGRRQLRCGHARAALSLYPYAHAARNLARGCGK